MTIRTMTDDLVAEATGQGHRDDAVLSRTGGPAGNARLTAWTGLMLLALFLAEMVTLISVRSLISWHIVIGVLLIPPALLKTGTTGWRIIRYYTGNTPYRVAGPPPLVLRLLGPLVVASTLAVLGSGLLLVLLGTDTGGRALLRIGGFGLSLLMIHKASFVVWGACTGLHTLARIIPALQHTVLRRVRSVPGAPARGVVLVTTLAVAALTAAATLSVAGAVQWRTEHNRPDGQRHSQNHGQR
jgi:hypothetical protein